MRDDIADKLEEWYEEARHVVMKQMCRVRLHEKKEFYDPEYSLHGERYYCYNCDATFDRDKKIIKIEEKP